MNAKTGELLLLVVGAALELIGLVLTFIEIRARLRSVRHLQAGGYQFRATLQEITGLSDGVATMSGGQPPTLEQRVAALEQKAAAVPASIRAAEERARERANENTRRGLEDLQHNLMQYVDRLRTTIAETAGGSWTAFIGPVLIGVGLFLQTASNVWQIWQQA